MINSQDRSGNQKFHLGHKNDISAYAIDSKRQFIATGDMASTEEKPVIRIWNALNGQLLSEIPSGVPKGNPTIGSKLEKEIKSLSFSKDGMKLVGIGNDINHTLSLFETSDGWLHYKRQYNIPTSKIEMYFSVWLDSKIFYAGGIKIMLMFSCDSMDSKRCIFGECGQDSLICGVSLGTKVAVGTKDGSIYIIEGNSMTNTKRSHTKAVTCMTSYPDGFITGSMDYSVIVWDKNGNPLYGFDMNDIIKIVKNVKNSLIGGCNAIDMIDDKIVVGTKRCNIIEITVKDKVCVKAIMIAEGHGPSEVWGCSANPLDSNTIVSVGDDKDLFLWDITTKLPQSVYHLPNSSRCIDFHPTNGSLAVGLGMHDSKGKSKVPEQGGFLIIDIKTMKQLILQNKISNEFISSIKYSPNGEYLAVGSHDNYIYMYDVKKSYKLLYKFIQGSSYVTQCDFSEDNSILRICYGDYQLLFVDVSTGNQFLSNSLIAKKEWATTNTTIGWEVQGVWGGTNDKTDINACCSDPDKKLIVAVDDFNTVRLYRYPCVDKDSQYKKFYGHASHIPYCEFSFNGKGLVTCGGNDHTVLYWEVV